MQRRGYMRLGNVERDILSCSHCQYQILIAPAKGCELVGTHRCARCAKTICRKCAKDYSRTLKCVTWEKRMEAIERRDALMRNISGGSI